MSTNALLYEPYSKVFPYYEHYMALIILPLIVISPIITYHLIIKRLKYNYAEAIIIGIYVQATGFIIAILVEIVSVATGSFAFIQHNQIILIVGAIIQLWIVFDIIKKPPYWKSIIISFLLILLGFIIFFCYLRFAVPFIVSLFM
jgi:hypothetical protein